MSRFLADISCQNRNKLESRCILPYINYIKTNLPILGFYLLHCYIIYRHYCTFNSVINKKITIQQSVYL